MVETCAAHGIAGLILTNSTISRPPSLRGAAAAETGGLSGKPLFDLSTAMLARAFVMARGRLSLIGVGGVGSGAEALAKIHAGADLVQVYTAFTYGGPQVIARIKLDLADALKTAGVGSFPKWSAPRRNIGRKACDHAASRWNGFARGPLRRVHSRPLGRRA